MPNHYRTLCRILHQDRSLAPAPLLSTAPPSSVGAVTSSCGKDLAILLMSSALSGRCQERGIAVPVLKCVRLAKLRTSNSYGEVASKAYV
jgi:hypothetical protein